MRVLFDYQVFAMQAYGGISRYFVELATRMARIDPHSVSVFAPLHFNNYLAKAAPFDGWQTKTPRFPMAGPALRTADAIIGKVILPHRTDVDIFHETYYSNFDCCPRSAARVVTVYDMIHEKYGDSFSQKDRTSITKAHSVRRADHVICISENTRRDLIEILGTPMEKTSVVHLAHSLPEVKPGCFSPFDTPYILYVGNRAGYKNFYRLLAAYSRSPFLKQNFILVCFGGGPILPDEAGQIRSVGLSPERVRHLSGDDLLLARTYAAASCFVFPSIYEGFGIPPLEAMSQGCPVLCSHSSSMPEILGDSAEYFDPLEVDQIRSSLERLLSDSIRITDLVNRGLERCAHYTWDRCATETLAVYNHLRRS